MPRRGWSALEPSELSASKVGGLAKGTPAFLVAFCALAVATSFGGTAQAIWASTATDGTVGSRVAPDKIQTKWWPAHSRERSGCRVHWMLWANRSLQSRKDWQQRYSKLSAHVKHGHWELPSGGRTHRRTRSSGRRIGTVGKDPPRDDPIRECCSCHHSEWGRGPFVVINQLRARVAEMEAECEGLRKKRTRSLSVPSPDMPGVDQSMSVWGPEPDRRSVLMQTLIDQGSPEVQSFQPVVKAPSPQQDREVVQVSWCWIWTQGCEGGRSHQPRSSEAVREQVRDPIFRGRLEVPQFRLLQEQFERSKRLPRAETAGIALVLGQRH